jgi:sugar phosphate permease
VLAPEHRDRYGRGLGETGLLIGASLLGSTPTLILWGMLSDRLGERFALAGGLGICGAALLGAAEVDSFWLLLVFLLVAGAAGASVQSASGRAVMGWFTPRRRGLALGIRQTAIPIGGFAASVLLPHLSPAWGFRVLGLFCLSTAAIGLVVVREGPVEHQPSTSGPPLRDRRIWRLSWASTLLLWPQMCVVGFVVLFLHDRRGLGTAHAALVLAAVQVLGMAARIGSGAWSDSIGSRLAPLRRIAVASAFATAATAAFAIHAPLAVVIPVLVVTGGLAMSWNGLSFTAAAELAGGARAGAAIGIQQTALNSTAALLPPVFGALVGATGWTVGFALVALGPLAGFFALKRV